jgi:succinate-semialdehyde dehydrogenase/glutarate-semialdehyde dehydrogenase
LPEGDGAFYPPTVLANVGEGAPAYHEELFGPVAAIIAAADEDHAIRIANHTAFGLGAAVFTRDVACGRHIAEDRLDAGTCVVNEALFFETRMIEGE